ncbi:apoptosis-associated speck-like protein containing a CARD [Seriola aureovittata]|uniref:apoptosis-associated speck-like protein containing a CARD n=1 Tax=Seriola aureovittata TaxID=2871759 RepID=UPI0024BDACBD|nr:apoptosis-associated speck-like protein containing a CARD [Seriola aureovittata]
MAESTTAESTTAESTTAEDTTAEHFVDKHRAQLIWSVTNIKPVLDGLLSCDVINNKSYDEIMSISGSMQKMRALFNRHLDSSGDLGKNILFTILEAHEPVLMTDLKRKELENIAAVTTITKTLFEKLNKLSSEELDEFKFLIELEEGFKLGSMSQVASTQDVVELMVKRNRQDCLEVTNKVLKKMDRTDLVHGSAPISSATKDIQRPALIQRVSNVTSV